MKKRVLTLVTVLLVLLAATVITASAATDSGTCGADGDNLTWVLDSDGVLTVSGTGAMADYYEDETPWYDRKSSIRTVVIESGVTTVGGYAFQSCTALTSVTIPEGVTTIGGGAFFSCTGLTSVVIPEGVTIIGAGAFCNCTRLTSVTIPDGVTVIAEGAFWYCINLTSVDIPASVTTIGGNAFKNCTALTSVTYDGTEKQWDTGVTVADGALPDGVTVTFADCSGHSFADYKSNADATCRKNATETAECEFCYETDTREIADSKLEHKYEEYIANNDATCQSNATETGSCKYGCGETDTREKADSTVEHKAGEWITDVEPGPITEGSRYKACIYDGCGVELEREAIPALGGDALLAESGILVVSGSVPAKGAGWLWENGVLTLNGTAEGFAVKAIHFTTAVETAKIVLTGNTTLDTDGIDDWELSVIRMERVGSALEIATGDYTLSVNCVGALAEAIYTEGSLTVSGGTLNVTADYSGIFVREGDLTITDTTLSVLGTDADCIEVHGVRDDESVLIRYGVLTMTNSTVSALESGSNGIYCDGDMLITDSTVTADGGNNGLGNDCGDMVFTDSTISATGNFAGICSYGTITVDNCTVTAVGDKEDPSWNYPEYSHAIEISSRDLTAEEISKVEDFILVNSAITVPYGAEIKQISLGTPIGDPVPTVVVGDPAKPDELVVRVEIVPVEIVASGTCGANGENLTWALTSDGTLTISGKGAMADYDHYSVTPWTDYRANIKSVVIEEGVTSIGYNAFSNCTGLTSVAIPDGVTFIGDFAFLSCASLTSVTIPDGVTSIGNAVFTGCAALTSVVIPDGVTYIGLSAFHECTRLTSVTIPDSVTAIDYAAFGVCTALTDVTYGGTEKQWSGVTVADGAFPDGVTVTFADCTDHSFVDYKSNEDATCQTNATETAECEFCYETDTRDIADSKLEHTPGEWIVDVEPTADTEGSRYKVCINDGCGEELEREAIPPTRYVVASGTCGANVTWELDNEGVLTISGEGAMSDYDFCGAPWYSSKDSIKTVVIEPGVTTIGNYAFFDCSGLTSVTIPNGVTTIGEGAFRDCSGLTSVTIPGSVTSIGNSAFFACTGLTSVIIPDSVTDIGLCGFMNCTGLTSITIPAATRLERGAFGFCTGLTAFYVDEESEYYTARDGILFSKDMTTLIYYPAGKTDTTYVIPDGVTTLGDYSFSSCSNLTEVTISDSVTSIGYCAFVDCAGLTSVTIPGSVIRIDWGAFYDCANLTEVIFDGDAPTVRDEAFPETATLYYPAGAEGWSTPEWNGWAAYPLEQTEQKNGLHQDEDGVWKYYVDGVMDAGFTGLVDFGGTLFYVSGGLLDWNYTGLAYFDAWYYINGGVVDWNYTGLAEYYDNWFYVANGVLDWNYTGLVNYYGTQFYVANGVVDWNYVGLGCYDGLWYYVNGGVVDWGYTGLAQYYDNWFYMANGQLDWNFTGLVDYYGTQFYVAGGVVDWNYVGLGCFNDTWYFVRGGVVDWSYTGLADYWGNWFYVKDGLLDWSHTGLVDYYGTEFYVENGYVNWGFTGTVDGKQVEGGVVVG